MTNLPTKLASLLMVLLAGCATTTKPEPTQASTYIDQYPTQDRVEFALQCIEKNGGLRYETLYACVCRIDTIATQMTFKEYTEAMTFTFLRRTPGENGAVFRDPPKAKALRKQLKEAKALAKKSCFINVVATPK